MNVKKEIVDVLVIGAGPAGCVAASMVHKAGISVKVVEREKFPRFVIGESLLPRCMEALEESDLLEAVKRKKFQEKQGARFLKDGRVADYSFADQFTDGWSWTWQVPRAEFDLALANELQAKGVIIDFESTVTAMEFFEKGVSNTIVQLADGTTKTIEAKFIIDASGYGRVMPRLFNLDKPSGLDSRKALFAHLTDEHRKKFDQPDRILILTYAPGIWAWIIPFSNGNTSLGFVGNNDFFTSWGDQDDVVLKKLIESHPYLSDRFADQHWVLEPRHLKSWSVSVQKFYGEGFVLAGNATEFLDPVFSSGVMFATVSGNIAGKLVVKKLRGEQVDWEKDYVSFMKQGVDTFRSYVNAWYDGILDTIFYANDPDPFLKKQICSVLAGYVWDEKNPYVKNHTTALRQLAHKIEYRDRHAKTN